jgi:hypothetical protein
MGKKHFSTEQDAIARNFVWNECLFEAREEW